MTSTASFFRCWPESTAKGRQMWRLPLTRCLTSTHRFLSLQSWNRLPSLSATCAMTAPYPSLGRQCLKMIPAKTKWSAEYARLPFSVSRCLRLWQRRIRRNPGRQQSSDQCLGTGPHLWKDQWLQGWFILYARLYHHVYVPGKIRRAVVQKIQRSQTMELRKLWWALR